MSGDGQGALEIRGLARALLDDPLNLRVRGAGLAEALTWRARFRDDDARVWRATAARAEDLAGAWAPAKAAPSRPVAALASLRPVAIDVRVEAPDGRAAARTIERRLLADGVRVRRWRAPVAATLYLPAEAPASATLLIDATAGPQAAAHAALAGPLLASRGVRVLAVPPPARGGAPSDEVLALASEALRALAGAGEPTVIEALLPPGVATLEPEPQDAARADAWDALLAELGARPRDGGAP